MTDAFSVMPHLQRVRSRKATVEELQSCHSDLYAEIFGGNPYNRQRLMGKKLSALPPTPPTTTTTKTKIKTKVEFFYFFFFFSCCEEILSSLITMFYLHKCNQWYGWCLWGYFLLVRVKQTGLGRDGKGVVLCWGKVHEVVLKQEYLLPKTWFRHILSSLQIHHHPHHHYLP